MSDLLSIGELARRSGLSVSALRFYDSARVLSPSSVDASSGYRRYDPAQIGVAQLVAGLRRIGLSLAEIREAAEHHADRQLVEDLLTAHLRRLEDGLEDARREIDRLRGSFATHAAATIRIDHAVLARLVEAVRFAVSVDATFPILCGVLIEVDQHRLRLVATDRYRLAIHEAAAAVDLGSLSRRQAVVPTSWLDEVLKLDSGVITLVMHDDEVTAHGGTSEVTTTRIPGDFPDHERLWRDSRRDTKSEWPWGEIELIPRNDAESLADVIQSEGEQPLTVRHEFLLEAITAAGDHPTLHLDGPIRPLAISGADGARSLLMPVRGDVAP